jgi:hypothetical protein
MPSIFNQSGFKSTARPGIYARIDASALAGGDIESGNIALVGDFTSFQANTPVLFRSRRSMVAYDTTDQDLALLAQLAFSPSDDPNASNGASSIRIVNAKENTAQASLTLGALTLKSKVWGSRGNRLQASLAISGDTHTLDLTRNGFTEQFEIENDTIAQLTNTSGADVTLSINNGTFSVTGANITDITVTNSEAIYLKDVVNLINQVDGLTMTLVDPASIESEKFDFLASTVIADSATEDLKAPNYRLFDALQSSNLVTVTIDTTQAGALSASTVTATGGGFGNTYDWEGALQSIENENVQIVVLFSTDSGAQSKIANHLTQSALAGYERQAYTAIENTSTLAQIKTRAVSLNNAGIALVAQNIELFDPQGLRKEVDSKYLALAMAGMQAGSDIGEPLTRKRPRIIKTIQTQWNPYNDAEQALKSGLLFLSTDNLGVKVERSITSYLTDNNPIYSEISTYESVLASLRDLRQALADQIGRPTRASQLALIEGRTKTRLTAQVRDGIIKAFQNVQLEDLGDEIAISYEVAPVEPLNFVSITAVATRISL